MLYDRWRRIAREQADELALCDLASGGRFTFAQLARAAETRPGADGPVVFPQGLCAEFILRVLQAWRDGRVVCPLESSQSAPALGTLPEGCAHLKLTSASTGPSRLIAFTAEQLAADAENILETMSLRAAWPNLGVISLAHSYGFSNLVLPLLLHGIPLYLLNSPLPEALRRALKQIGPCTLPAVPALWRSWHEAGALGPAVRLAISAGAPLPLAVEHAVFETRGLKLHNFYGASECGGIAYDASQTPRSDPACVGTPMANVRLGMSADGCLEVRSAAVGQGYWPTPEPTLAAGCFRTSDLAELKAGQVFLRGRAIEQINVAGRKVPPEWIESRIAQHPAVRECLVFGVPSRDASRGETIVACVAVGRQVGEGGLRDFLLTRLPAWQIPREWWFVEALSVNERGKLSRAEWRNRFIEARALRAARPLSPWPF